MKFRLTLFVVIGLLSYCCCYGQPVKEKELKTEIKEVTVFLQGAQIFESGSTVLLPGKTLIRVKNLSPWIDEKSIRVKSHGDFTLLSVNHKLNYLNAIKKESSIDSLNSVFEKLSSSVDYQNAHLSVLKEKLSLMNENKNLGGTSSGVSLAQLRQAIDFFEAEITKIKEDEIRTSAAIKLIRDQQTAIEHQLKELNAQKILPTGEIEVEVEAEQQSNAKFDISYIVSNAGWYPKYDMRVDNVKSPLVLVYKAEVFQNTGVDWKNVKLRFSNAAINQSGLLPQLKPWALSYAKNANMSAAIYGSRAASDIRTVSGLVTDETGEPVPGVNVLIKGTTIGTVTGVDGRYSLEVPHPGASIVFSFVGFNTIESPILSSQINQQLLPDTTALNEVVVTGYGFQNSSPGRSVPVRIRGISTVKSKDFDVAALPVTSVVERQTTVEFEIQTPYTIKSNGEKMKVDLKKYEIGALYEYYAVPKIDKDAFLIARIVNWDQYNLLEGEANLYFEDAFVGRSVLNAKSLEDTLEISLGRDKSIVVTRERKEQLLKKQVFGSNLTDSRAFTISVKNKKSQPIKLTIFDQLPVALVSDIEVDPEELSNGKIEKETGNIKWEMTLEPQQQREIIFQYSVKYPKRERIVLE